jgi:hypothetical protein
VSKRLAGLSIFLLSIGLAPRAFAQATEAEMRAFSIPRLFYDAEKQFNFIGDYAYLHLPLGSSPSKSSGPDDYQYVRYTGVAGKRVILYAAWDGPEVPPPHFHNGEVHDSCEHAHTSYGVWAKHRIRRLPSGSFIFWEFLGGGGKSGVRLADGSCSVQVDNRYKRDFPNLPAFSWGRDYLDVDLRQNTTVVELILATLSNTHGWGNCPPDENGFTACHEQSWAIAYTLP